MQFKFTHSQVQKLAFMALMLAFVVMVLLAVNVPVRAEPAAPPVNAQALEMVPTPITTPSSLDALSLTSNLTVGGNGAVAGDLTVTGVITASAVISNANGLLITAPTAVASATPALRVNSLGANNDLLVIEKNSTPVFKIGNSGAVTISGPINGVKCYKGQQTVLGSATAIPATLTAAGISTPTWADQSFAAAPGNTYWNSAHTNSAGVVTFSVYQALLSGTVTPQAATTAVALDYEICGQ